VRQLSQICFFIAGVAFWFGGGVISIYADTDRLTGELLGIGIAVVFGVLGGIAHNSAENAKDASQNDG
jgi:hypothetical protein